MLTERGIQGQPVEWRSDAASFQKWCQGRTGFPFVDACMCELAATGYTSNRGRQNVASFLAKSLRHDWRAGAQVCLAAAPTASVILNNSSFCITACGHDRDL